MARKPKKPRSPLIEVLYVQRALHFGSKDLDLSHPSATHQLKESNGISLRLSFLNPVMD